jgi:hypothetical protein
VVHNISVGFFDTMDTVRSRRGVDLPLTAKWYNPRYREGIRYCFGALAMAGQDWDLRQFRYEGELLLIESDMWDIAGALISMSVTEREALGWPDLFTRAVMSNLGGRKRGA